MGRRRGHLHGGRGGGLPLRYHGCQTAIVAAAAAARLMEAAGPRRVEAVALPLLVVVVLLLGDFVRSVSLGATEATGPAEPALDFIVSFGIDECLL